MLYNATMRPVQNYTSWTLLRWPAI